MIDLKLSRGPHKAGQGEWCVTELPTVILGRDFSDQDPEMCPVVGACLRRWNDRLNDEERQALLAISLAGLEGRPGRPLIPSRMSLETTRRRMWMVVDFTDREVVPAYMRLAGLEERARKLEALRPSLTFKARAKREL